VQKFKLKWALVWCGQLDHEPGVFLFARI